MRRLKLQRLQAFSFSTDDIIGYSCIPLVKIGSKVIYMT